MIRGKKNFLPPVQLVYGFGYLFKLDESSIGNHINDRRKLNNEETESIEESGQAKELAEEEIATPRAVDDKVNQPQTPDPADAKDAGPSEESKEQSTEDKSEESSDSSDDEDAFPDTQLASAAPASNTIPPASDTTTEEKEEWQKYDLEEYGQNEDADQLPEFAQSNKADTGTVSFIHSLAINDHISISFCSERNSWVQRKGARWRKPERERMAVGQARQSRNRKKPTANPSPKRR